MSNTKRRRKEVKLQCTKKKATKKRFFWLFKDHDWKEGQWMKEIENWGML